jgi:2-(1,2-epoxy-1,2-dihydrophenyl)acetyl-CoA isomerase
MATVTLNDPQRLNALSAAMMFQLNARLAELSRDPRIRAVIIVGSGAAFCSGGALDLIRDGALGVHRVDDLETPGGGTAEPWRFIRLQFGAAVRTIVNSNVLFVAAINGPAAGVGLALALACDVVIASKENATLVPAFARLGLVPEVGTSWAITRRLGYQGALRFFTLGTHVNAQQAFDMGLVQELHPHDELMTAAHAVVDRMLQLPAHTLEMTKTLLRASCDLPFEASLRLEEAFEANCFSTRALPTAAAALLRSRL